ncbi:xanthine dehydrogenase family protein molybdopterin-binding subunit [Pseudomonas syringae]|uniref:xanthine dehydrogenase family protein molybdopterin-binding subunit n=1 Tax=Pseudomonas syringae TaxID=317 RepID=UPI001F454839|nr:molybdopterin cofactor-binding domain-containing protein [Pseudomonas syringae]MCF5703938.1 molybdopterin-dependent oxidoreductase [Pseudomonas syringae]
MSRLDDSFAESGVYDGRSVNVSRRRFLQASAGVAAGALVISFGIPLGSVRAAESARALAPGTRVPAFLEIRPDNTVRLQSPFIEGGQGIFTGMAQVVGEELDVDPASFLVENAPPGIDFKVMDGGMRFTGGSRSMRASYMTMRRLGASTRLMLLRAASSHWKVPLEQLTTEPGRVIHTASNRSISYGELAPLTLDLPIPDPQSVTLRDPATFRWIGKSVQRIDVYDKSTGKAQYTIDAHVEGMLHAAVQHAPRLGLQVGVVRNEEQIRNLKGVDSVHRLEGAVAVVAQRWWVAKRAVEALQVEWLEPTGDSSVRYMPADFDTHAYSEQLSKTTGAGDEAERAGDLQQGLAGAKKVITATYHTQYLNHAQLEPPSALAHFGAQGKLDLWLPNQAPDLFLADVAKITGLDPDAITLHSPLLGGFFGRHFLYPHASPYPQAIQLAKSTGRPIKVIWSREEEFLRDVLRPSAVVRFRGGLDEQGMPVALEAISATEGPTEGIANKQGKEIDPTAIEGLTGKKYAIPHRRIAQLYSQTPVTLGYWRSVGNSINDFLYEAFLDELADAGGQDPFELRVKLLRDELRLSHLLQAVAELSGGWKRGPFTAQDGTVRARGVAMASPFGTETAVIAEVSISNGSVKVHDIWQAIDPGSVVNPAIVEAQVNSAVALGLSQTLVEQALYKEGLPVARNYDLYRILTPEMMARVHVRVVESGAPMGGIGEPPLPAVAPAVANAVSRLTGQRIRSMPLSQYRFDT